MWMRQDATMRTFIAGVVLVAAWLGQPLRAGDGFVCDQNQSQIEVFVKTTFDSFVGRLEKYRADITFNSDATLARAAVQFDVADLKTGKDKRDRAMCEWLEADKLPSADFVLTSISATGDGQLLATGDFTFHGQKRRLRFPLSLSTQGRECTLDGEVVMDTRDYALPVIRMLGVIKVDPLVRVRFHLKGKRSES